jgi:hypothetical protein
MRLHYKLEAGLRQPKPEMYEAIGDAYSNAPAKVVAHEFGVSIRTVRRAVAKHRRYKLSPFINKEG